MKKVILLTTALAITSTAIFAQNVSFGIKGGVQQSSLSIKFDGDDEGNYTVESPGLGFQFGGVANISVTSNFSVQPNLLLNFRTGNQQLLSGKLSAMSIELPINALYTHNGFFIGAGPNFSYGISGKVKPFDDGDEDMDLYKGEDGDDALLKRFEIGVNALMGYQFPGGFAIQANYTRGFNDLINDEDASEDVNINFKQFGLTFSYMFGKKKK